MGDCVYTVRSREPKMEIPDEVTAVRKLSFEFPVNI